MATPTNAAATVQASNLTNPPAAIVLQMLLHSFQPLMLNTMTQIHPSVDLQTMMDLFSAEGTNAKSSHNLKAHITATHHVMHHNGYVTLNKKDNYLMVLHHHLPRYLLAIGQKVSKVSVAQPAIYALVTSGPDLCASTSSFDVRI
jgi:hypothetical protein